jgi:tRNA(fMet)-specific endonuclease VapC
MVSDLRVLEVSIEIAEKYGAVQAMLRASGKPAPSLDLLIAATALVHDATLVTHNVSDFANIPALQVEDWLTP